MRRPIPVKGTVVTYRFGRRSAPLPFALSVVTSDLVQVGVRWMLQSRHGLGVPGVLLAQSSRLGVRWQFAAVLTC